MTVSVEDYFQAPAFRKVILEKQWSKFEARVEKSTLAALDLLKEANASATFFVSSWTAQRVPELIREIVRQGHEIGSSGKNGVSFRHQTEFQLREEARSSRAVLEEISGHRIHGYRVADRRLTNEHTWALRVLAEEGYSYDSSLSPSLTAFKDEPHRQFLHREEFGDKGIWELPLPSMSVAGLLIPIAGGNYIRQLPEWLVERGIQSWIKNSNHPFILYFRVWDLDPSHPKITAVSLAARVRHYRNAELMPILVKRFLTQLPFTNAADYLLLPLAPERSSVPDSVIEVSGGQSASRDLVTAKPLTPLTVVVPCYNEETSLPYLVNSLRQLTDALREECALKFIFVDDGSQDQTWAKLQSLFSDDPESMLILHPQNRGIAAAILTGIRSAKTDLVASIDCDCSYDPVDLQNLMRLMKPGVACVTASPYHPEGQVLNVPGWRRVVSGCASKAYQMVLSSKLNTFTSCFRVYRRSAVVGLDLQEAGFVGIAELLGQLILQDLVVEECPATLAVRVLGYSKMKVVRNTLKHMRLLGKLMLLRLGRNANPRRLSMRKLLKNGVSRG